MVTPQFGDIIVFNNSGNWYSSAQHLFTQRWIKGVSPNKFLPGNRTHCALSIGDVCGIPSLLEAEEKVVIQPWGTSASIPHRIYRIKTSQYLTEKMMANIYLKDTNQWYGFMWLPYFILRRIIEVFHKDIRKMHPWFPAGVICSEEIWLALVDMGCMNLWHDLLAYLNEWNGNNFHASDAQSVIDAFPQYFELIDEYNLPT